MEIVEMDDKDVPDDVLEEARWRGTKCCLKNKNFVIRKNWIFKKLFVNENQ
jgi:hypothetical protein